MEEKSSFDNLLDEVRRQIQESLIECKRERLRGEYGMKHDYVNPDARPELQNEFLDYIMEFERQFAQGRMVTVRERTGNPLVRPLEEIPADELESALDALLELMFEHNLVVDFLGRWDEGSAYRYVTETMLDREIDDIRIEGIYCHLEAATPEYEVEVWVEDFVQSVFWQDRDYLLSIMERQQLYDGAGAPITLADFAKKLGEVWERLPDNVDCDFRPVMTEIGENEAATVATITWQHNNELKVIEAHFRLQRSRYYGWDIVQTSLLDLLQATA